MLEDLKDLFRYNIYDNCRIMVNDLTDVINEIKMFLENNLYYILKETDVDRIIVDQIEITIDEKIRWKVHEENDLSDINTIVLSIDNLNEIFKDKTEYLNEVKEKFESYPKDLCGVSTIIFIETIYSFIHQELIEETNIFDICVISNNGMNNIIYELEDK